MTTASAGVVRAASANDTGLPKLSAWLRTSARAGTMPSQSDIATRFSCSLTHASRMLVRLEQDGVLRIDRSKPNRPKIIVVPSA